MSVDIKAVSQRFESLKEERQAWEPLWKDIRDYILPDLGAFGDEAKMTGGKRYQRLYDAEGANCADILAAGILSGVSSPSRPWLRLTTMDPDLDESNNVKEWLSQVQDLMLMQFAKSEVYNALHRSYLELPAFGTACSLIRRHPDRVVDVQNLTVGEYWLADDNYGRVDTLYRRFMMTAKQMVQQFGFEAVSNDVKSALEKNPFKTFTVIHAIEPRLERDFMKHDNLNKPWASIYYQEDAQDKPLSVSGFNDFPALCPRWLTTAGSVYGRGPGAKALSASKALQRLQMRLGILADYLTDPPVQYPAKHRSRLDLYMPGGRIPIEAGDNDSIRTAYEVKTDPTIIQSLIMARKQEIQSYFFANIFQMIAANQDADRTATEVAALEQEKAMMLGPVLERLHTEMLDPLVTQSFILMMEAGMVPEPPKEVQGKKLNVEYISVLAEAQKGSAINGILRVVQEIGTIAQLNPEALDKLDVDKTIDMLADMNSVPPSMIVAGPRVAMIRNQRAQQQAEQQQMMQAQAGAQSLRDLGQAADSPGLQQTMQAIQNGGEGSDVPMIS